jgi:maltose O-acetyltransferase
MSDGSRDPDRGPGPAGAPTKVEPLKGFAPSTPDRSFWRMALLTTKDAAPFMWRHAVGHGIAGSSLLPPILRVAVLRSLGVRIARPLLLYRVAWLHVVVDSPRHLSVGRSVSVSMGCFFEGDGDISLGDDCVLGPRVSLITSAHLRGTDGYVERNPTYLPVTVGRASWLGAGCMVMPGVTIGDDVTVAAGAVVTRNCIEPGVYAGVPARRIR